MSLIKSLKDYKNSNFHNATDEERERRAEICGKCEYNTGIRCKVCKCFIDIKIRMASESCPENKWNRVDGTPTILSKTPCKACNKAK